jgi:hypothetical protein
MRLSTFNCPLRHTFKHLCIYRVYKSSDKLLMICADLCNLCTLFSLCHVVSLSLSISHHLLVTSIDFRIIALPVFRGFFTFHKV